MRKVRIVYEFNVEDDAVDADLREAVRLMMDDIDEAVDSSEVLEYEGWGNPIVQDMYAEEEIVTRTYERLDV